MSADGAFGIHDAAYHIGRVELLAWLNNLLGLNIAKVEQCASGAPYCQIFDALFGDVPLKKVNFGAKLEHEYVKNYKILQAVFDKNRVEKPIPVERLIKGRYQDNLEFLQWCKRYFDIHYAGQPYDAAGRRSGAPGASNFVGGGAAGGGGGAGATGGGAGAVDASPPQMRRPTAGKTDAKPPTSARKPTKPAPPPSSDSPATALPPPKPGNVAAVGGVRRTSDADKSRVVELESANRELEMTIAYLEKERDFYYQKLRDIEILCQTSESHDSAFVKSVTDILWKEDEESQAAAAGEGEQQIPPISE